MLYTAVSYKTCCLDDPRYDLFHDQWLVLRAVGYSDMWSYVSKHLLPQDSYRELHLSLDEEARLSYAEFRASEAKTRAFDRGER